MLKTEKSDISVGPNALTDRHEVRQGDEKRIEPSIYGGDAAAMRPFVKLLRSLVIIIVIIIIIIRPHCSTS